MLIRVKSYPSSQFATIFKDSWHAENKFITNIKFAEKILF